MEEDIEFLVNCVTQVYFGNEVNWEKINKILNKYNLKLNEDGYVVDLEK